MRVISAHAGDTTILMLAVEADNKSFIAHAACQTLLNNIWMGRLSNDVGVLRVGTLNNIWMGRLSNDIGS